MERCIKIHEIIDAERIITFFQPIVSTKMNKVTGVEALSRGMDQAGLIPPEFLFEEAKKHNLTIALDRLCRRKALEKFSKLSHKEDNLVLFINIDASIIDQGIVGSGTIYNSVIEFNLSPKNIAIEINESQVKDLDALQHFIEIHKNLGFMIALDDVGAGHSNLSRLTSVKPDIVKVDKSLICGIENDFHKQATFMSLVSLSRKIGSLVVTEGIETENEAIFALDMGVDMLQGFLFSRPMCYEQIAFILLEEKIRAISNQYKLHMIQSHITKRQKQNQYNNLIKLLEKELENIKIINMDHLLVEIIEKYPEISCIYILSEYGIQLSKTVSKDANCRRNSIMFSPATKGANHSLKKYYYLLLEGESDQHITEPYISLATGELCMTLSSICRDADRTKIILCLDINIDIFDFTFRQKEDRC